MISIGGGLEIGWLPLIIRGSRRPDFKEGQKAHLVAANHVELLEQKNEPVTRAEGDVHPEGNPHFMLSPLKSVEIAKVIAAKLIDLDPKNKKLYKYNLHIFENKIKSLREDLLKKITKDTKVVSYHKTLTYFYNEFGIINIDVLEPKPGIPPTASHILKLIKKIKEQKVKKVIVENYFDSAVAKRIKKEISSLQIYTVPVAVEGDKNVSSIYKLYTTLGKVLSQ